MKNILRKKQNKAHRLFNFIWIFFIILLFIISFYYSWQQYNLYKQKLLQTEAHLIANKVDHLINKIIDSARAELAGHENKPCKTHLIPILKSINFNSFAVSGAVIRDKKRKKLCSTVESQYIIFASSKQNPFLWGPLTLDYKKEPTFLLQQSSQEYELGLYILKQVLIDLLKVTSLEKKLITLYDKEQNKNLLETGQSELLKTPTVIQVFTPLKSLPGFKIIIREQTTPFNRTFFYLEFFLTLTMLLLTYLLYLKFKTVLTHRYSLNYALLQALKFNQFFPVYQPIWNQLENRYCGAEILIRWQINANVVVMPDVFIEEAENSGLIVPISLQLIEITFMQCQLFIKQNSGFYLSFNISKSHFFDQDFFVSFYRLCENYQIPKSQVMLEITERELLNQSDPEIIGTMADLRAKGYLLAIDDFGTGHASIKYLQDFPFNYLKIDKMFIQAISTGAVTEILNEPIIHMANCLKLKIIAEGVETSEQVNFLNEHHVNLMQGWYFTKALSYEDLIKII